MVASLLGHVRALLLRVSLVLPDPRPRARFVEMGLGLLCGQNPKTITSAIEARGAAGDWSSDYRLFSKTAWAPQELFNAVLAAAVQSCPVGPLFAAMDDTLLRKTGHKIPGTAYARDPLSPPFRVNLVLGQRFLQTALLARPTGGDRPWRAVPVAFRHTPPLRAPPRATDAEVRAVREARKIHNMSTAGREELSALRMSLDRLPGGRERPLIMTADGSFANRAFLAELPERTTAVVRIRRDARLRAFLPPERRTGARRYGPDLPSPEQMLADDGLPLRTMTVFAGGRPHTLKYKVVENVCWPRTTGDRPARLVLLKPLGYRLHKGGKLLYRQPGFLFVTGADAQIAQVIQAYMARWEIEVSFRDEKTILGVGKAQVWNSRSVATVPAFLVAAYSCLLLASLAVFDDWRTESFGPLAPWRTHEPRRPSTRDLVRLLRKQVAEDPERHKKVLRLAA